jgi:hypothetical protein
MHQRIQMVVLEVLAAAHQAHLEQEMLVLGLVDKVIMAALSMEVKLTVAVAAVLARRVATSV